MLLAGFWEKSLVLFLNIWALWLDLLLRGMSKVEMAGEVSKPEGLMGVLIVPAFFESDLLSASHWWFFSALRAAEPLLCVN